MNDLLKVFLSVALIFLSFIANANSLNLSQGAGVLLVDGGVGREHLKISVHYNLPKNFSAQSPILMVLPGSGRTANKYRDRWIQASEKYGVLILSPAYSKTDYPKSANYNLARMVRKENGQLTIRSNPLDWIFSDLDRVFDMVVTHTGSTQARYDVFGHSAGGQFSHRLALFYPQSKANRILAANSGWYTTTEFDAPFPYGLNNGPFDHLSMQTLLNQSFAKQLVVFLGDKDDESEKRGSLRRDKGADKQGLSRIARGKYFYNKAKSYALRNDYIFNWKMHIVKGVGHSSTQMSAAAAKYLYSKER